MLQTGLDFSAYIAERTRDFVGREWVFAEIDAWLADADCCFVVPTDGLEGDKVASASVEHIGRKV